MRPEPHIAHEQLYLHMTARRACTPTRGPRNGAVFSQALCQACRGTSGRAHRGEREELCCTVTQSYPRETYRHSPSFGTLQPAGSAGHVTERYQHRAVCVSFQNRTHVLRDSSILFNLTCPCTAPAGAFSIQLCSSRLLTEEPA